MDYGRNTEPAERLSKAEPNEEGRERQAAFTVVELLTVVALLVLWATLLLPALAHSKVGGNAFRCMNNLRQLTAAWRQYAVDNTDALLASQANISGRTGWITGTLDYNGGNRSNWDPNQDLARSPLWRYLARQAALFRCPADHSTVYVSGDSMPRVRSYSMSHVFGAGEWLNKSYDPNQSVWRTYSKSAQIVNPAKTFLFLDEHPDSINDGSFANACTGAQPTDAPSAAQIIDFPASWHNGACVLSFADGRCEVHKWLGATIKPPVRYNDTLMLNVPAGDSWMDVRWLAANTTVRR